MDSNERWPNGTFRCLGCGGYDTGESCRGCGDTGEALCTADGCEKLATTDRHAPELLCEAHGRRCDLASTAPLPACETMADVVGGGLR